jgi:hypothetical protein
VTPAAVHRRRTPPVCLVLLTTLALAPDAAASPWSIAAARAEPAPAGLRRGAPGLSETADASRREAAAAFADAEAAFDRGEYPLAAERFARAHALSPHPWTLYNLALSRARSGDALGAWLAFDELGTLAASADERGEARAERDALRPLLAFVHVRGPARARVCVDETMVELGARGELERALRPGVHRLTSARDDRRLELAAGTTTLLDARPAPPRPPRARPWLIAATVLSGAALGGSTGAAVVAEHRLGRGLAGGAAAASGAALAASIAALVVVHRHRDAAPEPSCARTGP